LADRYKIGTIQRAKYGEVAEGGAAQAGIDLLPDLTLLLVVHIFQGETGFLLPDSHRVVNLNI
jgi:hypothetical protein